MVLKGKKISIIIPVYNVERYLYKCVGSILNQTYSNFEVILVNDGSTDNSGLLCDLFASITPKVKVIHQKNQGVSVARNNGLKCADGEYIHFCDADDFLEEDAYKIIMDQMFKENADAAYFGWSRDSRYTSISQADNALEGVGTQYDLGYTMLIQCGAFGGGIGYGNYIWNKIFRRECLEDKKTGQIITFDETVSVAEDGIWLVYILKNLRKGVFIPKPLYHYVINPTGVMYNRKEYVNIRLTSQKSHIRMLNELKNINFDLYETHKMTCNEFFMEHVFSSRFPEEELINGTIKNLYEVNEGNCPPKLLNIINDYIWLQRHGITKNLFLDHKTMKWALAFGRRLKRIKERLVKK